MTTFSCCCSVCSTVELAIELSAKLFVPISSAFPLVPPLVFLRDSGGSVVTMVGGGMTTDPLGELLVMVTPVIRPGAVEASTGCPAWNE